MPFEVQNSSLLNTHADEPGNAAFPMQLRGLLPSFLCANLTNCAVLCAEQECARESDGVPGNVFGVVGLA